MTLTPIRFIQFLKDITSSTPHACMEGQGMEIED